MRLNEAIKNRIDILSDQKLAQRIVIGDQASLEAFCDKYADLLHAYIAHRLGDSANDVEDIWQDTMICAIESMSGYKGSSRLFTWLCAIANHRIADSIRRKKKNVALAFSDLPEATLASLADDSPTPEAVAMRQVDSVQVLEALAQLPTDYAQALMLRYADECSVEEVACALGKNYKSTESLLGRAREAFRKHLAHVDEEVQYGE